MRKNKVSLGRHIVQGVTFETVAGKYESER